MSFLLEPRANFWPTNPWQDIIGLRNILVHEYFGIYWPLVWQTAIDQAPTLRAQIAEILKTDSQQNGPPKIEI